jgi:hypothetical protein
MFIVLYVGIRVSTFLVRFLLVPSSQLPVLSAYPICNNLIALLKRKIRMKEEDHPKTILMPNQLRPLPKKRKPKKGS